jgi:hypothetical protein
MIPETISAHAFVAMIYIASLFSMSYILFAKMMPAFCNLLYTDKTWYKELAKILVWMLFYFTMGAPIVYVNQFFK